MFKWISRRLGISSADNEVGFDNLDVYFNQDEIDAVDVLEPIEELHAAATPVPSGVTARGLLSSLE